jgi:hypothetical protein
MRVSETQRWRFIAIPANGSFDVRIAGASAAPSWRQVARDGADLPSSQMIETPAQVRIGVGVTMDFEFTARAPGEFQIQVDLPRGINAVAGFATHVPIRVLPRIESRVGQNSQEQRRDLERALTLLDDAARWQGNGAGTLTVSGLLWTVFCVVEGEAARVQRSAVTNEACTGLERAPASASADARTVAEARAMIRRALDQIS